ncbi:MAG: YihA family ribosome biogenesis GTP-binding protein [Alphaproteobacteria bacterium]|nr:YihA family ribosome biogenesis GTP-binding protein [Alphaproteobacteria bacterium]
MVDAPTPEEHARQLERGRLLFAKPCTFVWVAGTVAELPPDELPEVAFAGRSNVGKSSLLNALVGQKALANVSQTPGRTQKLNFFELDGRLRLVDLPGYGYAKVAKDKVDAWTQLIEDYLRGRPSLRRALLLIDARVGIKDSDEAALRVLDAAAVATRVVLTKVDKVKAGELAEQKDAVARRLKDHAAAFPEVAVSSAQTGAGIAELRADIAALVGG